MNADFVISFVALTAVTAAILLSLFLHGTRSASAAKTNRSAQEIGRMHFAAGVVCGLGYILSVAMVMAFLSESKESMGAVVFDGVKTVVPPIITLVLGYYFGSTREQPSSTMEEMPADDHAQRTKPPDEPLAS